MPTVLGYHAEDGLASGAQDQESVGGWSSRGDEPSSAGKSSSGSGATLRNSSNTFILSLAIAVTSFIFVVDEGDEVALVLPDPAFSYTTSWDATQSYFFPLEGLLVAWVRARPTYAPRCARFGGGGGAIP